MDLILKHVEDYKCSVFNASNDANIKFTKDSLDTIKYLESKGFLININKEAKIIIKDIKSSKGFRLFGKSAADKIYYINLNENVAIVTSNSFKVDSYYNSIILEYWNGVLELKMIKLNNLKFNDEIQKKINELTSIKDELSSQATLLLKKMEEVERSIDELKQAQ